MDDSTPVCWLKYTTPLPISSTISHDLLYGLFYVPVRMYVQGEAIPSIHISGLRVGESDQDWVRASSFKHQPKMWTFSF